MIQGEQLLMGIAAEQEQKICAKSAPTFSAEIAAQQGAPVKSLLPPMIAILPESPFQVDLDSFGNTEYSDFASSFRVQFDNIQLYRYSFSMKILKISNDNYFNYQPTNNWFTNLLNIQLIYITQIQNKVTSIAIMSANKAPKESLIQYHPPAEVMNLDSATSENKRKEQMYDSRLAIDQLLNQMFPSITWQADSKNYKQVISTNPPSREDVNTLQKMLDQKLVIRQARDSGICPIREQLHKQCFDQIIRQVTIDSPERGILLMRVRDQLYMTISAYQTLYDSSLTFSMRKQLQSEQGTPQLESQIIEFEEKKNNLEQHFEELKKKKDLLDKQIKDRKLADDKKRAEQIDFLKYQASHLQNFLRSVNEANK